MCVVHVKLRLCIFHTIGMSDIDHRCRVYFKFSEMYRAIMLLEQEPLLHYLILLYSDEIMQYNK